MEMNWTQTYEPVKPDQVSVEVRVTGWSEDANRQVAQFIRGLFITGVTLSGEGKTPRVFALQ